MAANRGFTSEDLWVERGNQRIYGKLYLPEGYDGSRRLPAIICAHYFSGSHCTSAVWARLMARAGYAAYAFDFCGGSPLSRSTGATTECTIFTHAADLSAIIDAFKKLDAVDPSSIFLLGQSQGGAVSAMAAAERGDDVAGLVLLYPAFVIHQSAVDRFGSPENVPETYLQFGQELGRDYALAALSYDFYEHVGAYTGPVIMFQGDADDMEPKEFSDRAASCYADLDYEIIPGAGHMFEGEDRAHVAAHVAAFVAEHSRGL